MNRTEQYVSHATRGLWGKKRFDTRMELRGAIEDKIYRHRLLGLNQEDAEIAALRDLGNPHQVAWHMTRVHAGGTALKATLLLGMVGLLSLQAVAQVATVKSAFQTPPACGNPTPDTAQGRAKFERLFAEYGSREGFLAQCRTGAFNTSTLLNVADLLAALEAGGVTVTTPPELTPATALMVMIPSDTAEASFQTVAINGGRYLESTLLIPYLKRATSLPLTLTGKRNPTLRVGNLTLQLGTAAAPVLTEDLLTTALIDERSTNLQMPLPMKVRTTPSSFPLDPAAPQLAVPGKDGDYFAVVQNILNVNTQGTQPETLWVRARHNGKVAFTDEAGVRPQLVNSQAELDQATASKVKAALVYRIDFSNLHRLKLLPIPAAQLSVIQP